MPPKKEDIQLRISLESIAEEQGEWLDAPSDEKVMLKAAIFESLFNYVTMATDSRAEVMQMDALDPEAMIGALIRRTELDVLDALLKTYEKRFKSE